MAKKKTQPAAGRPTTYPWDRWLKPTSRARTLKKGKDYSCNPFSMNVHIRRMAKKHGVKISISTNPDNDDLKINFVKRIR